MSNSEPFSVPFYRSLLSVLSQVLREFNHNLTLTINKCESELTQEVKGNI